MQLRVTGAPQRLDRFLVAHWPARIGRRRLAVLLDAAEVRVNGARARKSTRVHPGDEIEVQLPPETAHAAEAPAPAIVHEDANLVAVDKPPGVPSTDGPSGPASMAARLRARYPEMTDLDGPHSAGLVHRLDTGTSGILLAARHASMHATLRRAFHDHAIQKRYLAVVYGDPGSTRAIDQPLRRHPRSRGRMIPARVGQRRAWAARTELRSVSRSAHCSLVELSMETGVTHQLRVHLAGIGCPILGDARYGLPHPPLPAPLERHVDPAWHYLHAASITVDLPGAPARLVAEPPAHWRPLMAELGWPLAPAGS